MFSSDRQTVTQSMHIIRMKVSTKDKAGFKKYLLYLSKYDIQLKHLRPLDSSVVYKYVYAALYFIKNWVSLKMSES